MAIPKDIRIEVADKKMTALIIGGTQSNERVKEETEKLERIKAEIRDLAAANFAEGPDGALFEAGPGLPAVAVTKAFKLAPVDSDAADQLAIHDSVLSSRMVHYDVPAGLMSELLERAKLDKHSTLMGLIAGCRRVDTKINTAGFWAAVKENKNLRKLVTGWDAPALAVSFLPAGKRWENGGRI